MKMTGDRTVVLIETRGDTPAGHFGSTLVTLLMSDPDGVECVVPNGLDPRYLRRGMPADKIRGVTSLSAQALHWAGCGVRLAARRSLRSGTARRSKLARSVMYAAVRVSYALDEAAGIREALRISPDCVPVVMTAEPRLTRFVETLSRVGHLRYLHEIDEQPNRYLERFASLWARWARPSSQCQVFVAHPALVAEAARSESVSKVAYAPFAVAPAIVHQRAALCMSSSDFSGAFPVRVLLIGRLWGHKQCERTLDGILAAFPGRAVVTALAGEDRLREEADSRGVPLVSLDADCLTEDELDLQIAGADVIVVERKQGVRRETGSVIRCLGASTPIVLITDDPFLHKEFGTVPDIYPVDPEAGHKLTAVLTAAVSTPCSRQDRRPSRYQAAERLQSFRRSKQQHDM